MSSSPVTAPASALGIHGEAAVRHAQALVRCPSVTPVEGGALDYLETVLKPLGFSCHRLRFSAEGTADVENLFARLGTDGPHLCFAGHTDVVPPGDAALWSHAPFAAEIAPGLAGEGEMLFGRGAVDMKGNIASFIAAVEQVLATHGNKIPGSISFLITGDEEGPAINGTIKVLQWMAENGHLPDHCIVGEPSNPARLGDAIKIGRRGSLNCELVVTGRQGHSAYPQLANNPIPGMLRSLNAILGELLDHGTEHFEASNLELTSIDVGNPATNVIPASISAKFNIRYNDLHTAQSLELKLRTQIERALGESGLAGVLTTGTNCESFVTAPGPLINTMVEAVQAVTGLTPELSTGGGTSDARFIKNYCPVIEFGLVNKTIHAIDERVALSDLVRLKDIYARFMEAYWRSFAVKFVPDTTRSVG